jgi:spoIIIJ-associated protein
MEASATGRAPESPRTPESYLPEIEALLGNIIRLAGLDVTIKIRPGSAEYEAPEWIVDFGGGDSGLLLESRAVLLDALAHIASKAARLDESLYHKIAFDCCDYRKTRAEELRLIARLAAEQVIESGEPYALNPMTAAERRTVHLALKDDSRIHTESQGFGADRRVVIKSETRDKRRETS